MRLLVTDEAVSARAVGEAPAYYVFGCTDSEGFVIVAGVTAWVMYHKYHLQNRVGLITGVSLLIFFGSRFALEFMKNPQVVEETNMTLNIGQWLSVPLILLGGYLIYKSKTAKV